MPNALENDIDVKFAASEIGSESSKGTGTAQGIDKNASFFEIIQKK